MGILGKAVWIVAAVMVCLSFSFVTSAQAGTGVGAVFNLGKNNAVNVVSRLTGNNPGVMLSVENNSNGQQARGIDVRVKPNKAPITVNADAGKAKNLNADKLDGKDANLFLSNQTQTVVNQTGEIPSSTNGSPASVSVDCPSGQKAIGGGAAWIIPSTGDVTALDAPITASAPLPGFAAANNTGWQAAGRNFSTTNRVLRVYAVCVPQLP